MKRHPADLIAFIAGLIFVLIGSAYLGSGDLDFGADGTQWLLPLALIGLGIAGLAGSIAGARRARNGDGEREPVAVPAAEPAAEPANHDQGAEPPPTDGSGP
ncbi:MAG TPA: hypothetical protein VKG85_05695 [Actinomycetes bacterium]|nr:hypothetical protein [Actinomycetes bacterium]